MRTLLFLIAFCFIPLVPASAQISENFFGGQASLVAIPAFPNPLQTVTITLDDYSLSTAGSRIDWFVNSQAVPSAANQRELRIQMGNLGETTAVEARITTGSGQVFRAQRSFSPVYIDLIVEPLTVAPLFYQGRTLPIFGSTVALTALVHTSRGLLDASQHSYTWRLNNQVIGGGAARGNFKTTMTIPHGRNQVLSVTIDDSSGQTIAQQTINLPIGEVDVQFYEVSTLFGLRERAVTENDPVVGTTATYQAVPYNLDYRALSWPLHTAWKINGIATNQDSRNPFEITINRQGSGSAKLKFEVRSLEELLQGGDREVTVRF